MNEEGYARSNLRGSFELAHDLAGRATDELNQAPERPEASKAMGGVLAMIEAARRAFEVGDPMRAGEDLADAVQAAGLAREAAKCCMTAMRAGRVDLAFDLLDQTVAAIDRATHRMRNSSSCHTTFGAIGTPTSERLP